MDVVTETESGDKLVQLVRWRARLEDSPDPTKYWQRFRTYNIRSAEQWEGASRIVDAYFQKSSDLVSDPEFIRDDTVLTGESRESEIEQLENQVIEARAAEQHHLSEKRRVKQRLSEMRRHIGTYRKVLQEFQGLISNPTTNERMVHRFIEKEKPFWLFGLEYVDLESRVRFPPRTEEYEFDFMLRRLDGYRDLVELKGPGVSLFDRRTRRRSKLNVALSTALGQVLTYLNECDRYQSLRLFKPKAVIVIGNDQTDNPRERRLLASHLARVDIMTYSDLLNHGTRLLKHIQARTRSQSIGRSSP